MTRKHPRSHAVIPAFVGVLVAGLAEAVVPSKADVACVKALNAGGLKVASAQQKLQRGCVVGESRGKLPDADACIAADARGGVAKATAKVAAASDRKCAVPPPFAFTGPATVSGAAVQHGEGLLRDLLDGGGGLAVIASAADKAGARCQQKVALAADALLRVALARFAACARKSLGGLQSAAELRDTCLGALAAERADPGGKVAKAARRIAAARTAKCDETALPEAFPGACAGVSDDAFDACAEERAACRACQLLDAMDGLDADCDTFDDGVADGSCAAPATTSTSTSTTTSTSASTTTTSSATTSTTTSLPPPAPFMISIGDTVSDGVPAPGAGNIETPGSLDVYVFDAAPGQTIFFDEGAFAGTDGVPYRMTDEDGAVVVGNEVVGGFEPGVLALTRGGTYTITVGSPSAPQTGTYAFTLWSVPAPDSFAIALDQAVSDGMPAAGAGNIETPGARDVYTFDAAAGAVVYVDEQGIAASINGLAYTLTRPSGASLFLNGLGGFEPGRLTLPETGTYTLTVGSDSDDAVGTYAFTIHTVPPDDVFGITLDEQVSDGVPAAGAGNIEAPGARDVYTFDATAGAVVYVDEQGGSAGAIAIAYRLATPSDVTLVLTSLGGFEPGRLVLPETGTYTLTVGSDAADATATYAFTIRTVPPDDVFAIAIGDTISDGVPGPGAGNIETPGARDEYTFDAVAGTDVVIDEQSVSAGLNGMAYRLLRPGGAVLLTNALGGFEPGVVTLPDTGTYTLRVGADANDGTGTYGIAVLPAP